MSINLGFLLGGIQILNSSKSLPAHTAALQRWLRQCFIRAQKVIEPSTLFTNKHATDDYFADQ
jgi:hypothetical protein